MDFEWSDQEQDMQACQEAFNEIPEGEAIFMSHYELAGATGISPEIWKRYLQHPAVAEWMTDELKLFKQSQMKKLIKKSTSESKSVGTAQMINALGKNMDTGPTKEGPVFIYCYIPLNEQERHAPNVRILDHDIFMEDGE